MFTTKNVTTILFWLAFCAFLATSIPHVAWVYYSYEAHEGMFSIVFSYGIAVGIDVLVCWLSYLQATKKRGDKIATWLFIVALAFLSWYCNYLYTMAYSPQSVTDVWSIHILLGYTTTGYVTPIIISAIPLFIIGYTFMLSRLSDVKRETLEEKANRLEQEKIARDKIAEANKGRFTSKIKTAIASTMDIVQYASNLSASQPSTSQPKASQPTISQEDDNKNTLEASQERQEIPLQPEGTIVTPLEEMKPLEVTTETLVIPEASSIKNGHNIRLEHLVTRKKR